MKSTNNCLLITVIFVAVLVNQSSCGGGKKFKNKYSADANNNFNLDNELPEVHKKQFVKNKVKNYTKPEADSSEEKVDPVDLSGNELPSAEIAAADFRSLQKPFRMAKLNMVWSKAQQRLTEPKLKSMFTELKIQDKEELQWKQQNSQHKDKDGLKEAELRKKLIGIMSTYGILEHFADTEDPEKYRHYRAGPDGADSDNYINKSLFKDKKLMKLWEKAEVSGFSAEELSALKEEFLHHQDKIQMYYSLLDNVSSGKKDYHENAVNEDELEQFNEISSDDQQNVDIAANQKHNNYLNDANLLRDKHRNLRDNFDRLERMAAKGPNSKDFIEPKVQSLWRIASHSNFTVDELASLKVELIHYESRLLKLRHLHAEHALNSEKYKGAEHRSKHDKHATMEDHIKKQSRKVEKLQETLEKRIFSHTEL